MSRHSDYRARLRNQVIDAYGGVCTCCGESHRSALDVDHVNGGGNKDRRQGLKGSTLCKWLIENKFPSSFQLLCASCNQAKARKGECPHVQEQPEWIVKRINFWRRRLYKFNKENKEVRKDVL